VQREPPQLRVLYFAESMKVALLFCADPNASNIG